MFILQKVEQRKRNLLRARFSLSGKQHSAVSSILRGNGASRMSSDTAGESLEHEFGDQGFLRRKKDSTTACCGKAPVTRAGKGACCAECAAEAELPVSKISAPDMQGGEMLELVTGGSSKCNLSGDEQVITNNNDECSRSCTQNHEQNHVDGRSSCCEQARSAFHTARDDGDATAQNRIMRAWNQWIRTNKDASECAAYAVSMSCASNLIRDNDCDSETTPSTCCEQLSSYLSHVTERKNHHCGRSSDSTDRTDCPDFS
ncbi:MAG: hypothetical protein ABFS39_04210 [Pseudomonadota bacterium]